MTTSSILSEVLVPRSAILSSFRFLHKLPTYISQTPSPLGRPTPSPLSTPPVPLPMQMGPSPSRSPETFPLAANRRPRLSRFLHPSNSPPSYSVKRSSPQAFPRSPNPQVSPPTTLHSSVFTSQRIRSP